MATADIVVALGGDGLMLQTLHRLMNAGKPIYGMNRGTVGFLMNEFREDGLKQRLAAAETAVIHPLVMIARDTEKEARDVLREIIDKANRPAVEGFHSAVQQAGNSTSDKRGMWADSTFEDLVQYNDGFRTQLIGTPEQIAERIAAYRKRGVDLVLGGFLHFQEEVEYFGKRVLPLVRELEAAQAEPVLRG